MPDIFKIKLKSLLKNCDGVGISGTNENSDNNLIQYSKIKKIVGIHASETLNSCSVSKSKISA